MENKSTSMIEKLKNHFIFYGYNVIKDHYADFKGRANRADFWYFQLYMFVFLFISGFIFSFINLSILPMLISLALFLPALGMSVRRLHDLGKTWHWILISIVPGILTSIFLTISPFWAMIFNYIQLAANVYLLVLFCMKGENKTNSWGTPRE